MNLADNVYKRALKFDYILLHALGCRASRSLISLNVAVMVFYSFTLSIAVRSYHAYQDIWRPEIGDELYCQREATTPLL